MKAFDHRKYRPAPKVVNHQRQWPDRQLTRAPEWCSVDLRDGNQALVEPMTPAQKSRLFNLLVDIGCKHIEVGFPAASQQDFDFVRDLIEQDRIPDGVTIQVLTQARDDIIERTFAALDGASRATVHLYNSTSTVQREQVFRSDRQGIIAIATRGARKLQRCAEAYPDTQWTFQYSPESFTATEPDFAVEICNAVIDIWQPTAEHPAIINLPATVEISTPNTYADQIERFCERVKRREALQISVHTHNDRGCAVAAAELALLAGAQRVEGTLLGNGERTGNMDIVTMAMNLYSQGIDPALDLSQMDRIIHTVQQCTGIATHPRHPYAGELVFTAFSGSHQDAIAKCLEQYQPGQPWNTAYLPIDPEDLGRSYDALIRINSQSGKGGMAYIIERHSGIRMPRWLQVDFSSIVQQHTNACQAEVDTPALWGLFRQHYLHHDHPWQLVSHDLRQTQTGHYQIACELSDRENCFRLQGTAKSAVDAFVRALTGLLPAPPMIMEHEVTTTMPSAHAAGEDTPGKDATAFVQLAYAGRRYCAVGHGNAAAGASMAAVLCALNRAMQDSPALQERRRYRA